MVSDLMNAVIVSKITNSLNPYCNGTWSLTKLGDKTPKELYECLNPYCNGTWSLTANFVRLLSSTCYPAISEIFQIS